MMQYINHFIDTHDMVKVSGWYILGLCFVVFIWGGVTYEMKLEDEEHES